MNAYHLDILTDLRQKRKDVERNYDSFRKEYDRLEIERNNILQGEGQIGYVDGDAFRECRESQRATFKVLERLHDESEALQECIMAIEKLC